MWLSFLNRELDLGSKCIIQMEGQKTTIFNTKVQVNSRSKLDVFLILSLMFTCDSIVKFSHRNLNSYYSNTRSWQLLNLILFDVWFIWRFLTLRILNSYDKILVKSVLFLRGLHMERKLCKHVLSPEIRIYFLLLDTCRSWHFSCTGAEFIYI